MKHTKSIKKKAFAIAMLLILLFTNYSFAASYDRTGGKSVGEIASVLDGNTYIESDYIAKTVTTYGKLVENSIVSNGETETIYSANNKKGYYFVDSGGVKSFGIQLDYKKEDGEKTYENGTNGLFKVLYPKAIKYGESEFNFEITVKSITIKGDETPENNPIVYAYVGSEDTRKVNPHIHVANISNKDSVQPNFKVSVETENRILNDAGQEVEVHGVMNLIDIDLNQGIFVEGFTANQSNVFIKQDLKNYITQGAEEHDVRYKTQSNGTYFYTTYNGNTGVDDKGEVDKVEDNVYILPTQSKTNLTFTFDSLTAGSSIVYTDAVQIYHKVEIKAINGDATGKSGDGTEGTTFTQIKDDGSVTATSSPNTDYYLESITLIDTKTGAKTDVTEQAISATKNGKIIYTYGLTNINSNYEIIFKYSNVKVTFDAKGGTAATAGDLDDQKLAVSGTATKPADPTRAGYNFVRWQKKGTTTAFNFSTPITVDTDLEAVWDPIKYKIEYVLNGGTNDSSNPAEYTVEDEPINFKSPTKAGYDFKGWYEDENFTKPITQIADGRTGDVKIYAKWEAKKDIPYKVEYYTETTKGKYELIDTVDQTGTTGQNVTATQRNYAGYKENTTIATRKATGTVAEDGSLVLKLYYDKLDYTVTFEPNGGTEVNKGDLDNQTVRYRENATKPTTPTKTGYDFVRWEKKGTNTEFDFATPITENTDLEAVWTPTKYKINYVLNGGTNDAKNPDTYVSTDEITFKDAKYTGYTFEGWYEDANFTKKITNIKDRTGDITLYAKWSNNVKVQPVADSTVATKDIPKTGVNGFTIAMISVVAVGGIFAIRYFKLKNMMK